MNKPLPIKIAGVGWHLPQKRVTSSELATTFGIKQGIIERTAGVIERRYANGETSVGMAAQAAQIALTQAGIQLDQIDAIIGASTAMQQVVPCTAAFVQRELGAPEGRSVCYDMNATCLSFLVALQHAAYLITAGVYQNVLIYSSEIVSPSLNPKTWESSSLFGDAAVAVVVTRSPEHESSAIWHSKFATFSSGAELTQCVGGGTLHHPNDPNTTREMNMFEMSGPQIFRQALRLLPPFADDFFNTLGWQRSDVDLVVPHQASRHGVEQIGIRLGFAKERVFSNLAMRGNCVAASIPLAFAEAIETGKIQRNDKVLLIGTGAGLTLGAIALVF